MKNIVKFTSIFVFLLITLIFTYSCLSNEYNISSLTELVDASKKAGKHITINIDSDIQNKEINLNNIQSTELSINGNGKKISKLSIVNIGQLQKINIRNIIIDELSLSKINSIEIENTKFTKALSINDSGLIFSKDNTFEGIMNINSFHSFQSNSDIFQNLAWRLIGDIVDIQSPKKISNISNYILKSIEEEDSNYSFVGNSNIEISVKAKKITINEVKTISKVDLGIESMLINISNIENINDFKIYGIGDAKIKNISNISSSELVFDGKSSISDISVENSNIYFYNSTESFIENLVGKKIGLYIDSSDVVIKNAKFTDSDELFVLSLSILKIINSEIYSSNPILTFGNFGNTIHFEKSILVSNTFQNGEGDSNNKNTVMVSNSILINNKNLYQKGTSYTINNNIYLQNLSFGGCSEDEGGNDIILPFDEKNYQKNDHTPECLENALFKYNLFFKDIYTGVPDQYEDNLFVGFPDKKDNKYNSLYSSNIDIKDITEGESIFEYELNKYLTGMTIHGYIEKDIDKLNDDTINIDNFKSSFKGFKEGITQEAWNAGIGNHSVAKIINPNEIISVSRGERFSLYMIFITIICIVLLILIYKIIPNRKANISKEYKRIYQKRQREKPSIFRKNIRKIYETMISYYTCDPHFLYNFLHSLKTRNFVILLGGNGVGKTAFVEAFVKGIYNERFSEYFKKIIIKSDFDNNKSFLGLYDKINNNYLDPNGLTKFITKAYNDKNNPYFLLLDEINIANIEQYFPEILEIDKIKEIGESSLIGVFNISQNETPQMIYTKLGFVRDYEFEVENNSSSIFMVGYKIPSNLFIIGTANIDRSIEPFTGKVLDRADIILVEYMATKDYGQELEIYKDENVYLIEKVEINTKDEFFVNKLQEIWGFSDRVKKSIIVYLCSMKDENKYNNVIFQKMLPRVFGEEYREKLDKLHSFCVQNNTKYGLEKTIHFINNLKNEDFLNFWKING